MSKKVGVLFSGGLDSTYLIWKNLNEGNEVQPIYVEIENNKIKTKIEKNRIELLVKEFRNEFKENISNIKYILKTDVNAREDSVLFKQIPIWILAILFSQDLNVDEIQIGYIGGDDALGFLNDIHNVYDAYKPLMKNLKPLVFPLSKHHKYEAAHELPEVYHKYIYSCEMPTIIGDENAEFIEYEPCCECTPCTHIIASNYYGFNKFPENYKKNLLKVRASAIIDMGYDVLDKEGRKFNRWCGFENPEQYKGMSPHQLEINFPDDELYEDKDAMKKKLDSLQRQFDNFTTN